MFADIIKCINIFLLEQIKIACYTKQMFVNIYSLYKVYMPISEIISTIINKISVRNTVWNVMRAIKCVPRAVEIHI